MHIHFGMKTLKSRKLPPLILLTSILLSAYALPVHATSPQSTLFFSKVALPFDPETDALCFQNSHSGLYSAKGPLGWWARQQGVCTGMSALVGSFLTHANFQNEPSQPPSAPTPSVPKKAQFGDTAQVIQNLASLGCTQRAKVQNFRNLHTACENHTDTLIEQAIDSNALRVLSDLSQKTLEQMSNPLTPEKQAQSDFKEYQKAHALLKSGKPALLVVRFHSEWSATLLPHTVLVTGMRVGESDDPNTLELILNVYDSNSNYGGSLDPSDQRIVIPLNAKTGHPDGRQIPLLISSESNSFTVTPLRHGVFTHSLERPSPSTDRESKCCSIVKQNSQLFSPSELSACAALGTNRDDWSPGI